LQKLLLSNNQLTSLPDQLGDLRHLHELDLSHNQLTTLPESIGQLTDLEALNLLDNRLTSLPESIGALTKLRQLRLADNQLAVLPETLDQVKSLHTLDLSRNPDLTSLPIASLSIEGLNIAGCPRLTALPEGFVSKSIDISGTGITQLPSSMLRPYLYWNGVRIDTRIAFEPHTITAQEILAETNAEKRRVMLERMGFGRFMDEAQPDILDRDHDVGGERRLLRIALPADEPLVCLQVSDPSTARRYLLRVPPTMLTCHQAAAWVAGFDNPDDYHPLIET
jgi:hypothetical protein